MEQPRRGTHITTGQISLRGSPRACPAPSRKGMSFLEVVVALAILGMVAATSFAAITAITSQVRASRSRLAATELANRLILQYMDDPTRMPQSSLPIEYAGNRYRWTLREGSVTLNPAIPPESAERTSGSATRRLDRFKTISLTVWLGEESGGSYLPQESTPVATLTRLMDPYTLRNPDAIDRLMADPDRRAQFIEAFTNPGAGTTAQPGAPRTPTPPNTPRSRPRRGAGSTSVSGSGDSGSGVSGSSGSGGGT